MTRRGGSQDRTTSEVDFRTPPEVFSALQERFNDFNLDVASSDENALCSAYFTEEGNALDRSWGIHREGTHVWCNPPYNHIQPWIEKGIEELWTNEKCESITYLVPASTCTQWFKMLWDSPFIHTIIFITGRLAFQGPHVHPDLKKASSTNPSVVIHLDRQQVRYPNTHVEIERVDRDEWY